MSQIRNFLGISGRLNTNEEVKNGWERIEIPWESIEPRTGVFDEAKIAEIKKEVKSRQDKGKKILIMISKPPVWAVERNAYSFADGEDNYVMGRLRGIRYAQLIRSLETEVDGDMASEELVLSPERLRLNQKGKEEWKKAVEKIGTEFSGMSEYVQIYDMPFGGVENYYGSKGEFLTDIHKPAADILQGMGYKVVSGGLPNTYSIDEFVALLEENDMLKSIDVFNIYNAAMGSINYLYDVLSAKGINPYIWQTETGYENGAVYMGSSYIKEFYWTLLKNAEPDQFKVFFCENQSDDTQLYLSDGDDLTQFGRAFNAVSELLEGKKVEKYENYTDMYGMEYVIFERDNSSEAFLVDGTKLVIVNHMAIQNTAGMYAGPNGDSMHTGFSNSYLDMTISGAKGPVISKRYTIFNSGWEIPHEVRENNDIFVSVAVADNLAAPAANINETAEAISANRRDSALHFYTVLECADGFNNITERAEANEE